ncbi:hypothetical protein ACFL20_03305 [Spirochaetota bacterium]
MNDEITWILNIDNILGYSFGWGDLYENYNNENYNVILFNSNLQLGVEYLFFDFLSFGIIFSSSYELWGENYLFILECGFSFSYYYRYLGDFIPYGALHYSFSFFEEYAVAGDKKRKHSVGGEIGVVYSITRNFGISLGLGLWGDYLSVVNTLNGYLLSLKFGFKVFL